MGKAEQSMKAESLFGDFSDIGKHQDRLVGHEMSWEWPKEMGCGFMSIIKLRPGLLLGIKNYRLVENVAISFEYDRLPVAFGFSISGSANFSIHSREGRKELKGGYKPGYSALAYLPEWRGTLLLPAGMPVLSVCIFIDPRLLTSILEGSYDLIPADLHDVIEGGGGKYYSQATVSSYPVNMAIQQILDCPYQGALKRLYLECKAFELITYSLAQTLRSKAAMPQAFMLRSDEMERIHEARTILIRSLENPPSLMELARQVGTNKNKLNRGFREMFGTSVFDYLRIQRLERARELLEDQRKNVTEVAFEVGYSQQSNFTKAFKNHFGTNPTDHLR